MSDETLGELRERLAREIEALADSAEKDALANQLSGLDAKLNEHRDRAIKRYRDG
jgi:hypothetical protein